jgi:hypothetical protein
LFSHPVVRVALPVLAYTIPLLALALAISGTSRPEVRKPKSAVGPTVLPVPLLAVAMSVNILLVLTDSTLFQTVGLIGNWAILVAGLLLWIAYYRPALVAMRLSRHQTLPEARLYSWREPGLTFALLTALILLLTLSPPVDTLVESSAAFHHLQHLLLLTAGLLQAGIVYEQALAYRRRRGLLGSAARFIYVSNAMLNWRGVPGVLAASALVLLWHVPYFWDLALMNDLAHSMEHLSIMVAGGAIALSLPLMRPALKYGLLLATVLAMNLLALSLWVAETPVYSTYPVEQLQELGMLHFLLGMPATVLAVASAATAFLKGHRTTGGGA